MFLSGEDWDLGPGREFVAPLELADDGLWLTAHVVTHIVFFLALAVHVGMVARHQFVLRDGMLRRML